MTFDGVKPTTLLPSQNANCSIPSSMKRQRLSIDTTSTNTTLNSNSQSHSSFDIPNDSAPIKQGKTTTGPMIDVYTTAKAVPLRTPTSSGANLRKRRNSLEETKDIFDYNDTYDENNEEKRQDFPTEWRADDTSTRNSPRSPIAVLKLRRSNLFPEDQGKPITVKYAPSSPSEHLPSRSLASSMFLVSPLRPLAGQRASAPSRSNIARDLKAALIDSSKTFLRPLTPPQHKPKRSLSDANLFDDDENDNDNYSINNYNESKQSEPQTPQFRSKQQSHNSNDIDQSTTKQPSQQRWLISADHPYKILWDVLTFILSFANVYATHTSIRDRQFGNSWFMTFCEVWFACDILLNFITEYRSGSYALRDCRSVWARYLTTWFVVDVLSLFPGEALYLQPIIEQQNRRGFFKKNFFRTRGLVRVTRFLRGWHFRIFGQAANHTKHVGVGASRLLRLLIKYTPKYVLFFRNMKGVLVLRMLRQVHWFRKLWRNFRGLDSHNSEDGQGRRIVPPSLRKLRPRYNSYYNEDDDGVPF